MSVVEGLHGPAEDRELSIAAAGAPAQSPTRRRFARFAHNKGAVIGLLYLMVVGVVALAASVLSPDNPVAQNLTQANVGPSIHHLLGTDDLGRDILSRLLYGSRISIRVSLEVVGLALIVAIPVGLAAGYLGGKVDNLLMRFMDAALSFPALVLALAVAGVLGPGVNNAALAIAIVFVPTFARLIRGQALAVSAEPYVDASRAIGTRPVAIVCRRVFPNVMPAMIVQVALALGAALLIEAGLSFLGLGAQPPTPSWGSMLREAYDNSLFTAAWQLVIPGAAIASAVLAFNAVGDGLAGAWGISPERPAKTRARRGDGRRVASEDAARLRSKRGITAVSRATAAVPTAERSARLSIEGLTISFRSRQLSASVVQDLTLAILPGEIMALVGESGCGKTVTALAVMRLLESPPALIEDGAIYFQGRDLLSLPFDEMRRVRGRDIAMVYQDPLSGLNPAYTVGHQLVEAVRLHERVSKSDARDRCIELLRLVEISDPESRSKAYPHQLSGGMRQRVMIAMAISCNPSLLIADEPTTALDATVQAQILTLLRRLQKERDLSVLFVTHDLGVVAGLSDRVAVMYAGQIVETASTPELFDRPRHPYTAGLLSARPSAQVGNTRLTAIPGRVPALDAMPSGCRFHTRCAFATERCQGEVPALEPIDQREVRCLRATELELQGAS
jgi:peptide/nickel transport system permease protein